MDREGAACTSNDDHDVIGHGTACTALLLSLAPGVRVVPIRVFGRRLETGPSAIERAIDWAIDHGLGMLSLSLGTTRRGAIGRLYAATQRAHDAGILIVAAAGKRRLSYPAAFETVLSVGVGRFASDEAYGYMRGSMIECLARGDRSPEVALQVGLGAAASSFAVPRVVGLLARSVECVPGLDLAGARTMLERYASLGPKDHGVGRQPGVGG